MKNFLPQVLKRRGRNLSIDEMGDVGVGSGTVGGVGLLTICERAAVCLFTKKEAPYMV